jgi:hypothetical protein
LLIEHENVLHAHDVFFHAGDLGKVSHAAGAIIES